jgi:patatin-related protein
MTDPATGPDASTPARSAARPAAADSGPPLVKEVRLGLVCYGGVSLAIYMHGVTKELFKLVRAARAFDNAVDQSDFDPAHWFTGEAMVQGAPNYDTEAAYFNALAALNADGHPLTVVLDIIAGTSAGGINGVCLARGLAQGRSLNGFRQLWLDEGDMEDLLAGHAMFPWGRGKMLSKLAESVARLGIHPDAALLNGDLMCRLLHSALGKMEAVEPSLVRADESLDLFVTTTDVHGYETVVPSGAGGVSHTDMAYRQLLRFHYDQQRPGPAEAGKPGAADPGRPGPPAHPGPAQLSGDFSDVAALAFAARATASFPGAFPPVSLSSFIEATDPQASAEAVRETSAEIAGHFAYGLGYGLTPKDQWFMDGGVLDNGPWDHVLEAIAAKRADGPTAREIIYLEPDPGVPPPQVPDVAGTEPTFAKTIWAARVTIPQHTPLVGVLDELETMNGAIAEVGAIVEATQAEVLGCLDTAELSAAELSGVIGYGGVTDNGAKVRDAAGQLTGRLGYATYCRLRAQGLAESFGMSLAAELRFPVDSNQANFMVAVFCAWGRQRAAWIASDPASLETQLGAIDVPFRLRRAEFVLQAVNALFDGAAPAKQAQLAVMKSACWDLLTRLRGQQQQVAAATRDQAAAMFGPRALTQEGYLTDPDTFAAREAGALGQLYEACVRQARQVGLPGSSELLWEALASNTSDWDTGSRAALLGRYVGFPVWDSIIFPVIALAKLPQLTPVTVQRFSPLDATCLQAVDSQGTLKADPSAKLDGVSISHFGAFFDKSWRENDYLWGRLDGAELAIRLLSRQSGSDLDLTGYLRSALTAILAAEKADLGLVAKIEQVLGAQIAAIKPGALQTPVDGYAAR